MESTSQVSKEQLRNIVAKLERLEEEKVSITDAIKEVFQEASSNGFDVKTIKTILKLRKMDRDQLQEQDALIELYRSILEV
jgi:uncharacterized protein (UPF0335 family)